MPFRFERIEQCKTCKMTKECNGVVISGKMPEKPNCNDYVEG
jgi:hypothetical protein